VDDVVNLSDAGMTGGIGVAVAVDIVSAAGGVSGILLLMHFFRYLKRSSKRGARSKRSSFEIFRSSAAVISSCFA
jgi:hypothetical protein